MSNFLVILLCLLMGFLCKNLRHFPANTGLTINSFLIFLSLPGLILSQIPKLFQMGVLGGNWWIPVSMAWIQFGISFLLFYFLGQKLKWSQPKAGALILTAGLGNTSFVGFPLLETLIGREALPIGILIDQAGSFLALSTVGVIVAASCTGEKVQASSIARRILTFPPMIALIAAVVWSLFGSPGSELLLPVFDKIGSTLVPLALFAVGFQLRIQKHVLQKRWLPLTLGLCFKLVLAPALFAFLYLKLLGGKDLITHVTVLESAMAPMVTAAVVATDFRLDNELANLMVGIGIPLSLVTVPLWSLLFS
jgi:predicted permease